MKFIVNGYDWEITFVNGNEPKMNADGKLQFGLTEFIEQKISIRDDLSDRATRTTVIHELSHCFLFVYGIDSGVYDEEAMCNFLGNYADAIISLADRFSNEERG